MPDITEVSQDLALSEATRREYSGTAAKALDLLGTGVTAATAAATLGVSDAYISQLLSEEDFKEQVVAKRVLSLSKHNARDDKYDQLEDKALELLERTMPFVMDPMKLTRIVQTLNGAKRRGASAPEAISGQTQIVQLVLPNVIMEKFSVVKNADNMVIEAGDQKLITATSMNLTKRLEERKRLPGVSDVTPTIAQSEK